MVYVVDAADPSRFIENKEVLSTLLRDEDLRSTPFAIVGLKTDMVHAVSEGQLRSAIGLPSKDVTSGRPIKLFMGSLLGQNRWYRQPLEWMMQLKY